jgi:hypothetical protein
LAKDPPLARLPLLLVKLPRLERNLARSEYKLSLVYFERQAVH